MSLFERFRETKEQGFRDTFVQPLLVRLGFIGVTNKHGAREFGKDFVFSDLDRFGNLRHMVVQAKHEETIRQGTAVDSLLSQVKQAFSVPFSVPNAPSEIRHVSAVYVFNTGNITEGAQEQIRHGLEQGHRTNTHFYNGDQLDMLAKAGAMRYDESIRSRLVGLSKQLMLNRDIWRRHLEQLLPGSQTWDVRGCCLHAMEEFLSNPCFPTRIFPNDVFVLWQDAKTISAIVDRHLLTPLNADKLHGDIAVIRDRCAAAIERAEKVERQIEAILSELPEPTI